MKVAILTHIHSYGCIKMWIWNQEKETGANSWSCFFTRNWRYCTS